jgi:hypothetical protein
MAIDKRTNKLMWTVGGVLTAAVMLTGLRELSSSPAVAPEAPVPISAEKVEAQKQHQARFDYAVAGLKMIKHGLKDPSSVEWSEIGVNKDASVLCVMYRAKNSFAAFEVKNVSIAKGKASDKQVDWNRHCLAGSMFDLKSAIQAL